MLKKTITYTNYNDEQKTKDYYFNLKKSELIDLQFSTAKGFMDYIEEITKIQDNVKIWKAFRDIVLLAYGEKSDDGERFVKSDELRKSFEETEAFSELIYELMSNETAAANFINGIMPADLTAQAKQGKLDVVD